jgi:hypothetical protein
MSYPVLPTMIGSSKQRLSGFQPRRASNGILRMRQMWPQDLAEFALEHWLDAAQETTLRTFYAANRLVSFSYTWPGDGTTHTVRFVAPPQYEVRGSGYVVARVQLAEG